MWSTGADWIQLAQ